MPCLPRNVRRLLAGGLVAGYAMANGAMPSVGQEVAPGETPPAAAAEAPAEAIDQARIDAGLQVFKDAGCRACHGWSGNGQPEGPNPVGPSLRQTILDYDAIRMTVACGRPGTAMPFFYKNAYRPIGKPECYDSTLTQLGTAAPPANPKRFDAKQIDDLAYYVANYVKGKGDITYEQCVYFYGDGAKECDRFPH